MALKDKLKIGYKTGTVVGAIALAASELMTNFIGVFQYFKTSAPEENKNTPASEERKGTPAATNSESENMKKVVLGVIESMDHCPDALELAVLALKNSDLKVDSMVKLMGDIDLLPHNHNLDAD